jgi:hypothetical protein
MKYKDRFLGEIELTKVSSTNKNYLGCSRTEEIYINEFGTYYIKTIFDDGDESMMILPKYLVQQLINLEKGSN